MRACAAIRSRHAGSVLIVFALMAMSIVASVHHHRLVVPADGPSMAATASEDHPARSIHCVACRAADAVRLTDAGVVVPQIDVAGLLCPVATPSVPSFASQVFPPRGPPAQIPS